MPRVGFDMENAHKYGYIPAGPISRVVNRWCDENWEMDFEASTEHPDNDGTTARFAGFVGVHPDTIGHLRNRRNRWIEFDMADRIVTFIDPLLWHGDDELKKIYAEFDFSNLDVARPTSPEADDLPLLDGFSNTVAAAVLGIKSVTVQRQRMLRREAA